MYCNLPGSSAHAVFQAKMPKWVAIFFSKGSSQPRDQTCISCIAGRFFTAEPPGKLTLLCRQILVVSCSIFAPEAPEIQTPSQSGKASSYYQLARAFCLRHPFATMAYFFLNWACSALHLSVNSLLHHHIPYYTSSRITLLVTHTCTLDAKLTPRTILNSFIELQFTYYITHPFKVHSSTAFRSQSGVCITTTVNFSVFSLPFQKTFTPLTHHLPKFPSPTLSDLIRQPLITFCLYRFAYCRYFI